MAELKTKVTKASVNDFIADIADENRRQEAKVLLKLFTKATGEKPKMWGESMIGFGSYHYRSERSQQAGDWFIVGFSPRKLNFSLYGLQGVSDTAQLFEKLGSYKNSVGCVYVKTIEDIDLNVLEQIIKTSFVASKKKYSA